MNRRGEKCANLRACLQKECSVHKHLKRLKSILQDSSANPISEFFFHYYALHTRGGLCLCTGPVRNDRQQVVAPPLSPQSPDWLQCCSASVVRWRLVLVSRTLLQGLGRVSASDVFLLGLVSVSDWTDSGFLIKTGQDSVNTAMTR